MGVFALALQTMLENHDLFRQCEHDQCLFMIFHTSDILLCYVKNMLKHCSAYMSLYSSWWYGFVVWHMFVCLCMQVGWLNFLDPVFVANDVFADRAQMFGIFALFDEARNEATTTP